MTKSNDLRTLLTLPDETYANYLLNQDLQSIKNINKSEIINKSIECGISFANRYKDFTIKDLLHDFDLMIYHGEGLSSFSFYELAYFEEPNKLVLCENNINLVKNEAKNISEFKCANIEDIIIGHEIFHKIEADNSDIYTNNVENLVFKIGPVKKYRKVKATSEIGAMAFTKELLDLNFNPLIISYLLALALGKEKVIYEQIFGSKKNESKI